jgi:hypothetical protein
MDSDCEHESIENEGQEPNEEGICFVMCVDCDTEIWYHFSRPDVKRLA